MRQANGEDYAGSILRGRNRTNRLRTATECCSLKSAFRPARTFPRESLQKAMEADWSLSRYDILPDRIIFYMWSKTGGTKFNFKFRPRYGINAQTPASIVYDYYNEEAKAIVPPLKFEVK